MQHDLGFQLFLPLCIILAVFTNAVITNTKPPYIRELKVPATIVNGSESNVVLDCDYRLDQNETALLVVNWYYNHSDLVYQWIYRNQPQSLGILEDRVNLDFEASDVDFEKYRAVQIVNPTSDLTGEYVCKVSTRDGDAFQAAKMTVYSPATEFDMRVSPAEDEDDNDHVDEKEKKHDDSKSDEGDDDGKDGDDSNSSSDEVGSGDRIIASASSTNVLNITCWAYEVYPKPTVTLYFGDNDTNRQPLTDVEIRVSNTANGAFDTIVTKSIDKKSMSSSTLFTCELKIVDTHYYVRKEVYWQQEPSSGLKLRHVLWEIVGVSLLIAYQHL